ncbi:adenylate/guanylate cyclase domain-containing protein [Nocardia vinacea]|uniref:adenylate/guanylate cyclase domain-containing protein n=1 Tax=Nocardia vinacea TaxID=96468 RepID=UPI000306DD6D|nr:adenylate/guanylate cyclase domain-containing protein [Nocardia vinacea]
MTTNRPPLPGDIRDNLQKIGDTVDAMILGGPRKYTADEVLSRSGIDRERAEPIWRAMGFAAPPDEERAFTDDDVEALRRAGKWRDIAGVDDAAIVAITRAITQSVSPLATWEAQLAVDNFLDEVTTSTSASALLTFSEQILPLLEQTHAYMWRRQVAAYIARRIAVAQEDSSRPIGTAVGFADISGYTALTRGAGEYEIRRLLDAFESATTNAVGENSGRIVKMIGDAALFTADRPTVAADIALDLLAAWPDSEPPLRIGVASGPVVDRLGDIFGATVNIASRLTSVGAPGEALVDENMAQALGEYDGYRLEQRPPVTVRGYDRLDSWRLHRANFRNDQYLIAEPSRD